MHEAFEVLDEQALGGAPGARPCLVVEVPHGADREADYDALAARLHGPLPPDLKDFFFVNTDVGAWDLGLEVARRVVAARPGRLALAVRCRLPRTLVDANRALRPPGGQLVDGLTPGLAPWIQHPHDQALLSRLHARYVERVTARVDEVCGAGGLGLLPHSYAPRTVGVDVIDLDIAARLRAAWSPEQVGRWPLRPEVDLLTCEADGTLLAPADLRDAARAGWAALGVQVAENHSYNLHPATTAHALSRRHPGRLLAFEVRRDLLVEAWTPFAEMRPAPAAVARLAAPLAEALHRALASRGL